MVNAAKWDVLILDLDGTLLCSKGEVSDQNLNALDIVRRSGVEVIVATGRCFAECKHILDAIDHDGVCVTAGGSQLTDSNGKPIARDVVDESVVQEVTEQVIAGGHRVLLLKDATVCDTQYVLVGDATLNDASTWWFDTLGVSTVEVGSIEDDPWRGETLRVGAVACENDLLLLADSLRTSLNGRAKLQHWSAVTCSQATGSSTHLLEVFGLEVNKWRMVEHHLGNTLNPERIVAIGDGLNDIEILREAGLSIVMENATRDVQQHANVITTHHNADGFAHAMHRWVIQKELP